MRVPLWLKLGALFGGAYGLFVVTYGLWDWNALVAEEANRRRVELETLAEVVAAGIDADAHATFRDESARGRPEFVAAADALSYAIDRSETVTWGGTCARDPRGHWHYVVDGSRSAPFPVGFPIFDGVVERDLAFAGQIRYVDGLEDDAGTWHTVLAPIRGSDGAVVGLVELASDADREDLVLQARKWRMLAAFALAVGGGLVLSFAFGRLLSRHLGELVSAARRVARGRLETRVEVKTTDEIGVLAWTFNQMVDGLKEREFIRDTFGRFVNPDVVSQILADRSKLALGGETRVVTVLMSDLRGFTALSEELGAEGMVALLNRYLARMTAVVERWDGNVAELLGDGMVVLFGAPVAHPDDALRAASCAVAMHQELLAFNQHEGRRLSMGIGIDTGQVIAGNIGAERHMKYGVVGAAINVAARLETFTLGNQILVTQATRDAAGEALVVDAPIEFRAKGRREPVRAYPVRAAGAAKMPDEVHQLHVDVTVPATLYRVDGKVVDPTPHPGTVLRLEPELLVVRTGCGLAPRDGVKLGFTLDRTPLDELYGTVESVEADRATVRLTSVPNDARALLDGYIGDHAGEATGPRL
ncbi:MAG: adenylate/guanylate cyclase domain-containing protein [Myxococcota bacterium]